MQLILPLVLSCATRINDIFSCIREKSHINYYVGTIRIGSHKEDDEQIEEYLERDEDTNMCIAGSLREIWKALDRGFTIGTIKKGNESEDQISPIPVYQRQLLKMANASINQKEKIRIVHYKVSATL